MLQVLLIYCVHATLDQILQSYNMSSSAYWRVFILISFALRWAYQRSDSNSRLVHVVMTIPRTRVLLSTCHPIFMDVITLIHSNHARLRTCQYLSTLIQYCFFEVTLLHSSYERNEPKETLYRTATDSTLHWVGLPKSGGCEFF